MFRNLTDVCSADKVTDGLQDCFGGEDKKEEEQKKAGFNLGNLVQQACGQGDNQGGIVGDVIKQVCGSDDDQGGSGVLEMAKDVGESSTAAAPHMNCGSP